MVNVVVYGFGSLGKWSSEIILENPKYELVGVIDNNPNLVGTDVSDILGRQSNGLKIQPPESISDMNASIVLHSTITSIEAVKNQIKPCIECNMSVITTSEEMIYPWKTHRVQAQEIDELAKEHGVVVTATGVNPGFTTDLLPLILCSSSARIDKVVVHRVVDFSEYPGFKPPYMGFGMKPDEFKENVRNGVWKLGRNPLPGRIENIHLIADSLDWNLQDTPLEYEPIISRSTRRTPWGFNIEPGQVAGVTQVGLGIVDGVEKIRIESTAICHPLPEDQKKAGNIVEVIGEPSHRMTLVGGTVQRGGFVSSARQINLIPVVLRASPGLRTMRDLPSIPS